MPARTTTTASRAAGLSCRLLACVLTALAVLPASAVRAAGCVVLDYRLPEAGTPAAQEAIARSLATHLDWLHAHGVRFVNEGVDSGNVPAVCLSFSGAASLLEAMVDPILEAWAAPAQRHTDMHALAPSAHRIVLDPAAGLGELIEGLAARGLHARQHAPGSGDGK